VIGSRRASAFETRLASVDAKLDRVAGELQSGLLGTGQRLDELERHLSRLQAILQLVYDREPEFRERLASARGGSDYERAYEDPHPLVSIVIPTYDRGELLASRAIPSVLNQTYDNVEVIVVGDCAPAETGERIAELHDRRVSYRNLTRRGPYPQDPHDLWHVAGIPPRNLAVSLARGRWIAPLDDDDAFHPDHVRVLLDAARAQRHEVCYGMMRCLMNDGSEFPLGSFPPEYGQFGWQSAIFHAGLRFFEMELADSLFGSPADWSLCRRMLRAGVRFGMVPDIVPDHYESRRHPGAEPGVA
jgi:Glycosyl transferase family 2